MSGKIYASKEVFTGIYSPKRKLIEFSIRKKNIPGSLAAISKVIADLNINLLSGFITAYPDEPTSRLTFVADLTGLDIDAEDVVKKLNALDVVLDVRYELPEIEGLMVDCMHFPLLAIKERSVLFRVETMKNMLERLYANFKTGAAVIFYEMGQVAGERKAKGLMLKYGLKGLDLLKIIMFERIAKGWGVPEIVSFNPESANAVVRIHELFECYPFKGKLKEPRSQFFRGYLRGVFKIIFNKDVSVSENYCISKGDEFCEFNIS
jgi:predicted hydrocarbon binding protein